MPHPGPPCRTTNRREPGDPRSRRGTCRRPAPYQLPRWVSSGSAASTSTRCVPRLPAIGSLSGGRRGRQDLPGTRGGTAQRLTGVRHGPAAERPCVIGAQVGVALDEADVGGVDASSSATSSRNAVWLSCPTSTLPVKAVTTPGRRDVQPGAPRATPPGG